jgi:hypothetical protein
MSLCGSGMMATIFINVSGQSNFSGAKEKLNSRTSEVLAN